MAKCKSCDSITINGVHTHEPRCPDAWRDEGRECLECGEKFKPDSIHHEVCDDCEVPDE